MDNAGGTAAGDHVVASFQYRDTTSAAAWTPKFGLDYQIDERTLAYVSATRGYKSGGFNITAGCARRVRPGVGMDVRGGNQIVAAEPAGASERSGLFHGLLRPAGADSHRSRGARHQERGGGHDPWRRAGSPGPARSAVEAGGTRGLDDARYDRYLAAGPGGTSVDAAGRRLFNAPEWSGRTWVEYQDPDWRGWRMVVVAGGSHAEHRLFHGDQRSHRTAGPIRSRQRECHGTAASALVDRHFRAQPDRYGLRDRNEQLATARRCCPPG